MPRGCRKAQATRNAALSCVYPRYRWTCKMWAYAGLPFWRLSNRALAAIGGKCRCGLESRRTRKKQTTAHFRPKAAAHRGIRRFTFRTDRNAPTSGERKSKNHWFLAAFFPPFLSLLKEMGPSETIPRRSAEYPLPSETISRTQREAALCTNPPRWGILSPNRKLIQKGNCL